VRRVEVYTHVFLSSALDSGECSASFELNIMVLINYKNINSKMEVWKCLYLDLKLVAIMGVNLKLCFLFSACYHILVGYCCTFICLLIFNVSVNSSC
jgi:hypothetical protein